MSSFDSFNQFSEKFSESKFSADRSACPLFGLLSCYNFMLNQIITQRQHELNLETAVSLYNNLSLSKYMSFHELINLTDCNKNEVEISATSQELIVSNIIGYEHIFKFDSITSYCVLFLKNSNFIAVLCRIVNGSTVYSVRDCHEIKQYDFDNFDNLKSHLNNVYQFEQPSIAGGVRIEEFENIEFLRISKEFNIPILFSSDDDVGNMTQEELDIQTAINLSLQ